MTDAMPPAEVVELAGISLAADGAAWSFARERRAEIDAYWQVVSQRLQGGYNGQVLLQHSWSLADGHYSARYLQTDYASFLAWRDWGRPDPPMRNGYGMAALTSRDGAFLLGRMAAGTANAGRIYFAAGTPDPADLTADGTVDLAASVLRELEEETGLTAAEVQVDPRWTVCMDAHSAAFMRPVHIDLPAEEARALMLARIAAMPLQELCDIIILRDRSELPALAPAMPGPTLAFLQRYLPR
jgi:8-oxo-dGTP pyrophosphatase MutT (NUDIX family)